MGILENAVSIAVNKECRYKLAFLKEQEENLYDTVERLVDEEIARKGKLIPPMPSNY